MTNEAGFVFALIAVAGVLMASNRVRYDFVALIVVIALALSGTLTIGESLSGFGNSVVILVACLLVLGEMLDRTGVARAVGDAIMRYGGQRETTLLILIMVSTAFLGSVMSSTAVVAIFIPVILRIAEETGNDKARLLMPMSYAALISGMLTLIATPPNLVVSDELVAQGYQPLGLFSFFLIGALVLLVAVVFILFWGRFRLRSAIETDDRDLATTGTTLAAMWRSFDLRVQSTILEVNKSVPAEDIAELIGKKSKIVVRLRSGAKGKLLLAMFSTGMELRPGDRIFVRGPQQALKALVGRPEFSGSIDLETKIDTWIDEIGFSDVLVHPESPLIGRAVSKGLGFETEGAEVVALVRNGEPIEDLTAITLQSGDRLLIVGPWDALDRAVKRHDSLVLLSFPLERQSIPPAASGFWAAILIMTGMIAATLSELVSITVAVLIAAVAAVLFRTLSAEDAFRAGQATKPCADSWDVTTGGCAASHRWI